MNSTPQETTPIRIAIACRNASGEPDICVFKIQITKDMIDSDAHHEAAKKLAADAGYEEPFICFAPSEHRRILSAARELSLVPTLVAVDVAGGLVNHAQCDAGEIKVIVYDPDHDGAKGDNAYVLPLYGPEEDGTECWATLLDAEANPFITDYLSVIKASTESAGA